MVAAPNNDRRLIPSSFFTSFPAFPVKPNPLPIDLVSPRLFLSQKYRALLSYLPSYSLQTQLLLIFVGPCTGIIAAPGTYQIRCEIITPFSPLFLSTALPFLRLHFLPSPKRIEYLVLLHLSLGSFCN